MKQFLFLIVLFSQFSIIAQITVSGKVTDSKNKPILGANVYLDGTYDGTSTNEKGEFVFTLNSLFYDQDLFICTEKNEKTTC